MSSPPDAADLDVVVVGSGFGGAAAANRLALAGKRNTAVVKAFAAAANVIVLYGYVNAITD